MEERIDKGMEIVESVRHVIVSIAQELSITQ